MDPIVKAILDVMECDAKRYRRWAEEAKGNQKIANAAKAEVLEVELTMFKKALGCSGEDK